MASTDKMKCTLCNERNGKTRCEGCNTLFCIPCMTKHHDQLAQQFQLLMDVRNEIKQSLNNSRSTSSSEKHVPCLTEIDEWEREIIQRIRRIAANARKNVNELTMKHMNEISNRFEQISVYMQQQQKEGDYLENDIEKMKSQLDRVKNDIKHVNEKIQVDSSISNNIEWDTLIYVLEEELPNIAKSESVRSNQGTKNKKVSDLIKKLVTAEKFVDSSLMSFPTIPGEVIKQNSSSIDQNLTTDEPASVPRIKCLCCNRFFDDVQGTRLCPECDDKIHNTSPHHDVLTRSGTRLRPTDLYVPTYDRGYTPALSPTPKTRTEGKIICPYCKNLNLFYNLTSNTGFRCSACQYPIYSGYRYGTTS